MEGDDLNRSMFLLNYSLALTLRYIVNPDNKLTLRAQREIKEGEEVTIQYISFLFGNSKR